MVGLAVRAEHLAPERRLYLLKPIRAATQIAAAVKAWRRASATRRAFAQLTSSQLADVGYSEPPRHVLIVKAGLMTTLMSMR